MDISDASFIVVDVETTGMSAKGDRITEIAMLRVEEGEIVDRFESLINPERSIPSFIAEYTHITNAMVFGKPTFAQLLPEIAKFIERARTPVFVAHNVQFDRGFIIESIARSNTTHPAALGFQGLPALCTCRLAKRLTKLERRSLKHVTDYFGIKIKARHRAMGDAEATALALIQMLSLAEEEHDCESLDEILKLQFRKPKPVRKTKVQESLSEHVRTFPTRPGVYVMRDSHEKVIYVGKAKDLRDRVTSYFASSTIRSDTKHSRMMKAVRSIHYEETGSELSAILKESRLIKELKPQFNSLERRWKSSAFLKLDVQNLFPRIEMVREPAMDGAEYYGPFRSRKSVESLIEVLQRSFTLRECEGELKVSSDARPCFYYDIGRCKAPCAEKESRAEYRNEVERFRAFLASGESGILSFVEKMMQEASERLEFEDAQYLKLRLLELKKVLGNGDRPFASINSNDCVIFTAAADGSAELFFIRFGRLVKQISLTVEQLPQAEAWFEKQIRRYYPVGSNAIPPACGKPEIDEMRILASWMERKKADPHNAVVYVQPESPELLPSLLAALKRTLGAAKRVEPIAVPAIETKPTGQVAFTPTEVRTAKRLTLKPMKRRM
jgi:DNA polymerase-3 subunit epsilon